MKSTVAARRGQVVLMMAVVLIALAPAARADVVVDWSIKAADAVVEARLGPPPANRVIAIVQTAVYEAANAITRRYPASGMNLEATADASLEAAIAAASRATLSRLLPAQQAGFEAAFQATLAAIADGPAKTEGILVGQRAAEAVLAMRLDDGAAIAEDYRPHTSAGNYVPTVIPVFSQWAKRKPWLMAGAGQFRPGPPPSLKSEQWARDYNEIREMGARTGSRRSAEQSDIARFWEATAPSIFHGVVRSVANLPGRDLMQNARLFAAVTQASDDAVIAVFDAKYHYGFWRPLTAIRNGDIDGNEATERVAAWTPFIDTPMHPEFPCAHCIVASAVGNVLRAEIGAALPPRLSTSSPSANGAVRSWGNVDDFIHEVSEARIYGGVHYRNSTDVAMAMGRQVAALAANKFSLESRK